MRLNVYLAEPIHIQLVDEVGQSIARGEMATGEKMVCHKGSFIVF